MRGLSVAGDPSDVDIMKGHGLKGMVRGRQVYIGNLSGAEKLDIAVDSEKGNYLLKQQKSGSTAVLVAIDHEVRGIISMADQIREEAYELVRELKEIGIRHTVMLTGDNDRVARKGGRKLGLDHVVSELLPEDKVEKVRDWKEKQIRLAMVGDGDNDAADITKEDAGIGIVGDGPDRH